MRGDHLPDGMRLYWPVLQRLGDNYRRAGGGWNFSCPFPAHKNGDASPSAFVKLGLRGELVAHCNGCGAGWAAFVEFAGLPKGAWFPDGGKKRMEANRRRSEVKARYEYRDRENRVVAVKLRYEPGFVEGQSKTFAWERPVVDPDVRALLAAQGVPAGAEVWARGSDCLKALDFHAAAEKGKWVLRSVHDGRCQKAGPQVLLPPCQPGLYRLPDILAAGPRAVFCVEGEGKADLLTGLGLVATSGPDGKGKWKHDWGSDFAGRHLVVIPDRDTLQAEEWGCRVAASGLYYAAASVRVVMLPLAELPGGKQSDIKDWLARKFEGQRKATPADKRAAVLELVERFPVYRERKPKGEAA